MARIAAATMAKDIERASSGLTSCAAWPKGGPRLLGLGRVNLRIGSGAKFLDHVAVPVRPRADRCTEKVCGLRCNGR